MGEERRVKEAGPELSANLVAYKGVDRPNAEDFGHGREAREGPQESKCHPEADHRIYTAVLIRTDGVLDRTRHHNAPTLGTAVGYVNNSRKCSVLGGAITGAGALQKRCSRSNAGGGDAIRGSRSRVGGRSRADTLKKVSGTTTGQRRM
jgi:hypothetical protein